MIGRGLGGRGLCVVLALSLLAACSGMLPSSRELTRSRWKTFDEAKAAFDRIVPHQTSAEELQELGFDPHTTPNVAILNYLNLVQRFTPNPSIQPVDLDAGLRGCLAAKEHCRGYEATIRNMDRQRYGSLVLNLFNFRRKTSITGWELNTLVVLKDELVVYKIWSGKPHISSSDARKNPLGPLQNAGSVIEKAL